MSGRPSRSSGRPDLEREARAADRTPGTRPRPRHATSGAPGEPGPGSAEDRRRGRPARHAEPVRQTTIRLTRSEWAALQAQVTKETLARGERRYVTDIIRDAIAGYLARHG